MLKITLLLGVFDIIRCEMQTTRLERTISGAPSCRNPSLCYLSDMYKTEPRSISFLPYPISPHVRKQQLMQRSYYGGSSSPAYYHQYVFIKYLSIESSSLIAFVNKHIYFSAFDPISVLASLAFLAFLLQSFATLFDRSRSILPTIISGRQSDSKVPEISKHVSHALQEYVSAPKNNNS